MRNSNRPAGPASPTHAEREQADLREQIDEALNPAAEDRDPREGQQPTRNQPSPQARNESPPHQPGRQAPERGSPDRDAPDR